MNRCTFIGNLTRDPEFSTTGSGVSLCRFSIAVSRRFKRDGEPDADFFNVVTWRGLADNCHKYLSKGSKCCITGAMQNRSYEDKDGNKRFVSEIIADEIEFIGNRSERTEDNTKPKQSSNNSGNNHGLGEPVQESLPFF